MDWASPSWSKFLPSFFFYRVKDSRECSSTRIGLSSVIFSSIFGQLRREEDDEDNNNKDGTVEGGREGGRGVGGGGGRCCYRVLPSFSREGNGAKREREADEKRHTREDKQLIASGQ